MIVAFAGRRAQSLDGDLTAVAARISAVLSGLRPRAVVGAAADGADLMVLEAALTLEHRPSIHLVLPTSPDVFRQDSVEPQWQARFDAVVDEIAGRGGTMESLGLPPGDDAYRRANQLILDRAASLDAGEPVVVLIVARVGQGAMIGDLVDRARSRELEVVRIDPASSADVGHQG